VELPKIVARSEVRDLLVFLDGHFSGGETALGELPEPAIEEIKALGAFRDKVRAVVVDDFRSFGVEQGWPSKASLIQSFEPTLVVIRTHSPRQLRQYAVPAVPAPTTQVFSAVRALDLAHGSPQLIAAPGPERRFTCSGRARPPGSPPAPAPEPPLRKHQTGR